MIFLILLTALKFVFAHELTLLKTEEGFLLSAGHDGISLSKDYVLESLCLDAEGKIKSIVAEKVDKGILFKGRCDIFGVVYGEGDYKAFLKYVENPSLLTKRLGFDFEISAKEKKIPKEGRKMTFKVLYKGVALRGVPVAVNHKVVGRTRFGGEIRLRIRRGRNEITAFLLKDKGSFETTLIFRSR